MSRKRHLVKTIKNIFTRISRKFISAIKKKIVWLLRTLFVTKRRQSSTNAGFVLPTVAMVSIVVVLMTTAIMYRSYDRAQNASNVRVNQAVLSAATPAIDRGRAKLNKLFQDKRLPRATPSDEALDTLLDENLAEYTFGDETPLTLTYTGQGVTDELKTAWRFPIDTDNNGKFDTYTLYGIYFKTPPVKGNKYERARTPLEGRTPPMVQGNLDPACGDGTSAILVGNTGWIKQNNELKKSFFVYTATVPITSPPAGDANYEKYTGNKSIAAVEYQQDRLQIPPNNNAVVYEDDIILSPGPTFNLNGAIFTNSNFLNTGANGGQITLHQVSSNDSCYYEARNAKIFVGGNIALGSLEGESTTKTPIVHLFNGKNGTVIPKAWNKSVSGSTPGQTSYNYLAYQARIERLVDTQFVKGAASDPSDVTEGIEKRKKDLGLASFTPKESEDIRRQQLESYFRRRTRRVPYAEVPFGGGDTLPNPLLQGEGQTLRANDRWIYPTAPDDGKTATNFTKLSLNISGASLEPKASDPQEVRKNGGQEAELGDRVIVGNNLPELWWDKTKEKFVSIGFEDTQEISGVKWNKPDDTAEIRKRRSTVQVLADVGSTDRDGEWELDAARVPQDPTEPVGGLRVVTGAGIYSHKDGEPDRFIDVIKTVWPDTNPVPQAGPPTLKNTAGTAILDADNKPIPIKTIRPYWFYSNLITDPKKDPSLITYKWRAIENDPSTPDIDEEADTPYLQMRATAVYHYKSAGYNPQTPRPIACVSSFHVPTNSITARNANTLPTAKGILKDANGLSNNGIVYPPPTGAISGDELNFLKYQSELRYPPEPGYPNGRLIDDGLMARALAKAAENRTISEQSAIDAQLCAIRIRYNPGFLPVTSNPVIPHGAIRETTFLAHREVKQNSKTPLSVDYNLPIRDRQLIETRATVLDLESLRTTPIGAGGAAQEYLLPNSGLIYATRDDALPDRSDGILPDKSDSSLAKSALDYKLDSTRRPNAIMLVNGLRLWRQQNYRDAEKGFILATNLPAYIKGDFNKHTQEEFGQALADDWNNFYSRSTLNLNFACRPGDPRLPKCTVGDEWRPATVLADVVTLVSGTFQEGFRDQGDYDWSDQSGWKDTSVVLAAGEEPTPDKFPTFSFIPEDIKTQFSAFNNFVTQAPWADSTGKPGYFSSYLNNFVTPIGLRVIPGAYLTEVCPVNDVVDGKGKTINGDEIEVAVYCSNPKNWTIQTSCGAGGGNTFFNGQIVGKNGNPNNSRLKTGYVFEDPEVFANENNKGPKCFDDDAPRRIAFLRNETTGNILEPLQVLGIDKNNNNVAIFNFPNPGNNILPAPGNISVPWLEATINNGQITALPPVLQLRRPFAPNNNDQEVTSQNNRNWLQPANTDTTFNLIVAAGDNPSRSSGTPEDNGGLHNFVRFIEHWNPTSTQTKARITGAFMQVKKSAYATGPFTTAFSNGPNNELNYRIGINGGRGTGYIPPVRQWGYDVALLSQAPDLFAQKLVLTPPDLPDEYFREVSSDDQWVATLLCAKTAVGNTPAIDNNNCP